MSNPRISYKDAGVDVQAAEKTKERFASIIDGQAPSLLSNLGTFAAAIAVDFSKYKEPLLIFKMEEPGSKQVLALAKGKVNSLCHDLINHLVNDIAVMGAQPIAVQDCIVCGALDPDLAEELVASFAEACKLNDCILSGGETSVQPGVLAKGTIILSASVIGVADRSRLLDGSKASAGDVVFALPSNGPHTNGYTLIRKLLENNPSLESRQCGDETFVEAVLRPHTPYGRVLVAANDAGLLTSSAHITGSGIHGNLKRVIRKGLTARITLEKIIVPEVFRIIKDESGESDRGMLETFNMGVGATVSVPSHLLEKAIHFFSDYGIQIYQIGSMEEGSEAVQLEGNIQW